MEFAAAASFLAFLGGAALGYSLGRRQPPATYRHARCRICGYTFTHEGRELRNISCPNCGNAAGDAEEDYGDRPD